MRINEATKVLNLNPPFTAKDAKTAYRRLAHSKHPDKGGDNGAMAELNTAYKLVAAGISFGGKQVHWGMDSGSPFEVTFAYSHKKPPVSYVAVVRWFSERMKWKMDKNKSKGYSWRGESADHLYSRLTDEVLELGEALDSVRDKNYKLRIINECADVANFVMMLADKAEKQL